MKKKNILLITYYFPPNNSVGGRRWAKFAKNLKRNGHNVTVICAENQPGSTSPWDEDIIGLEIHQLRKKYPSILDQTPRIFFEKLRYKIALNALKISVRGTVYDRTLFWKKQVLKLANDLIESKKIDTIITNGPPFRLVYYCTLLKEQHPTIKFLADFRDPWTWWGNLGYTELKGAHAKIENEMEQAVLEKLDLILVPNEIMESILIKKYPHCETKIKILPHAYDEDDFIDQTKENDTSSENIKLIYFGTLYNGMEKEYRELSKALVAVNHKVTLDIFTSKNDYESIFHEYGLHETVRYFPTLPMKKIIKQLPKYQFIIINSPDFTKENISTKFFEIARTGVPFLFISAKGKASDFILEHNLGIHLTPDEILTGIQDIVSGVRSYTPNTSFNLSQYSFSEQTKVLEKYF